MNTVGRFHPEEPDTIKGTEEEPMRRTVLLAVTAALMVALAFTPTIAGTTIDQEQLADNLVAKCAQVQKNDIVVISGSPDDMELLEAIAVHCRAKGAFPLITVGSDRLTKRMFADVPAEFDSQVPRLDLEMAKLVDVYISLPVNQDMGVIADVPIERRMARAEAYNPVIEAAWAHNARQVNLGNGLNPTKQRAGLMGLTYEKLADIYWAGVTTDPTVLETRTKEVEGVMSHGRKARITNHNGTELTFDIEGRPVYCTEGIITKEDMAKGGEACMVWLPAGEVYLSPVPGTANGTVVVPRMIFEGKPIENLKLTFASGKLTDMTAESDIEKLKEMYDMAGEGRDEFAFVDVGVNPNVMIPEGSDMTAWMASGMVTIGVGGNEWAGGDNNCPFALAGFLPGSSLSIDDKPVVENGTLVLASQ
jgi:leucyl aminopeptidase (aminopeptidase T)